jgi:hypothetical protein
MAFSKREQSFCVLEYARSSFVVTVLAANHDNYVSELWLKQTWKVLLSISVRITIIHCVVYLLRIFKIFHGLKNNPVYIYIYPKHAAVLHAS